MPTSVRAPILDVLVEDGKATRPLQTWMTSVDSALPSLVPLVVTDFGALGNGGDDTAAFQKAISQAAKQGGASVVVPSGTYSIGTITFPAGTTPIELVGQGESTVLQRRGDLGDGKGLLDIFGSNVTLDQFLIDGGVTSPTGLAYNGDFLTDGKNDPMAAALTKNTSIWVHGPVTNLRIDRLAVQHTGGYAILFDAGSGMISDVQILSSKFINNRPHLFGLTKTEAIYGSWTGGIYINGDGRAANPGLVLKRIVVAYCQFRRNTGNCLWSHLYGLDELHEDFRFFGNYFEDCGLDGILIGGVTGGAVFGNVFRRIGYTTIDDTSKSIPRWLINLQATALDSSGLVKGVLYANNSFLSINGGCLDLDGHGDSSLTGNVCRCPFSDEPEYAEDDIAISGPFNNASGSYGINLGNTSNTLWGGRNVQISGNSFINLRGGSVRLYAARNCHVSSNDIIAPDVPLAPPIAMGPGGAGANQRSTGNVIRGNRVQYGPPSAAPVVFEDPAVGAFVATDVNYVFGNAPIIGNGNAVEFQNNPSSGSPHYLETVWFT